MFELSVLPADVDGQTLPIVLQCLLFTVFAHPLSVLGALHLHKTLKTHSQTLRQTDGSTSEYGLGPVAYLSQQPVGEVLADLAKGKCEVQDVLVGELAGWDPSDVDHLTGAALQDRNTLQSPQRAVVKPPDDLTGPGPGRVHLDGGVGGGMTDADWTAAHRRRHVTAVELGHGSSFFFGLKLKVGLRRTRR